MSVNGFSHVCASSVSDICRLVFVIILLIQIAMTAFCINHIGSCLFLLLNLSLSLSTLDISLPGNQDSPGAHRRHQWCWRFFCWRVSGQVPCRRASECVCECWALLRCQCHPGFWCRLYWSARVHGCGHCCSSHWTIRKPFFLK